MYLLINDYRKKEEEEKKKDTNNVKPHKTSWYTQKCKSVAEQAPFALGSVAASACEVASQDYR